MIREAAGLVAVNLMLAGLGAGALLVIGSWRAAGTAGALVLSPFTGIALYLALMPPLLYAGFAPTPQVLVVMTAVALALGVAVDRRRRQPRGAALGRDGLLLAAAAAVPCALLLAQASTKRAAEIDWQLDWAQKARLLTGHGGSFRGALDDRFFSTAYLNTHREYPLGLPALNALDNHAMGRVDTVFVHVQFVLVLIAFVAAMWVVLRPYANPIVLAAGLTAVAASPGLQIRTLYGPWDMTVACTWVAGAVLVGIWLAGGARRDLALGSVFLAGSLATKVEATANTGLLFLLVGLLLVGRRQWRSLRDAAVAAVAVIATAAPWQLYANAHDLHSRIVQPSLGRMIDQAGDLPTIVRSLTRSVVAWTWAGVVPLALACAVVMLLRGRNRELAVAYLVTFFGMLAALTFVYWNHTVALHPLLSESASRTITTVQVLTLVMLPLLAERALGDIALPRRAGVTAEGRSGDGPPSPVAPAWRPAGDGP